jgi:hypothetical protein
VYTLHWLVGYVKNENGVMVLAVKMMALIDLLLEFIFLCASIVDLRGFKGGDDWGWEARYSATWEDALLENNNPCADLGLAPRTAAPQRCAAGF